MLKAQGIGGLLRQRGHYRRTTIGCINRTHITPSLLALEPFQYALEIVFEVLDAIFGVKALLLPT